MNIRHILILPLCLALAPSFAQEDAAHEDTLDNDERIETPYLMELSDEELVAKLMEIQKTEIESAGKELSIWLGIKDKESADAACAELLILYAAYADFDGEEPGSFGIRSECWRRGGGIKAQLEKFEDEKGMLVVRIFVQEEALAELDPPFYGSRNLEKVLNGQTTAGMSRRDRWDYEARLSRLASFAEGLPQLHDTAEADAYAQKNSTWLCSSMKELLSYYSRIEAALTPEAARQKEELQAAMKSLAEADTHGSKALAQFQWGWRHLAGLTGQEADAALMEDCIRHYLYYVQAEEQLKVIFRDCVYDKESADLACHNISEFIMVLRGEDGSGCTVYTPAPEEFKAWMSCVSAPLEEVDCRIRKMFDECKAKGYFGSDALRDTIGKLDAPAASAGEYSRRHLELAEAHACTIHEQVEALRGVKDKETAYAAALRIAELNDAYKDKEENFKSWLRSFYVYIPVREDDVKEVEEKRQADLLNMAEMLSTLAKQEPPFYGSTALQEICAKVIAEADDE